MRKKSISMVLAITLLFSLITLGSVENAFASEGAWVMVDTQYRLNGEWLTSPAGITRSDDDTTSRMIEQQENKVFIKIQGGRRSNSFPIRHMEAEYTWESPPSVLQPGERVRIPVEQKVIANETGDLFSSYSVRVRDGQHARFVIEGQPDKESLHMGLTTRERSEQYWVQNSISVVFIRDAWDAGREGHERWFEVSIGPGGSPGHSQVRYVYEWQEGAAPSPAPQPEPTPAPPATTGQATEATDAGNRMEWPKVSGALGYRIFRSTDPNQLGESVTDFFIEELPFIDVNIQPNTDYHYTVKPVLREANPLQNIEEELGEAIATYTVRSSSNIISSTAQRSFIVLTIDKPHMIVNGVAEEIDPGRGTVPIITSGRTMVPIRAIVEAMGGTVGWDGGESKITLNARGNQVEMWLNRNEIRANGSMGRMDVAPVSIGGRTFVPLRFSTDNLDARAEWINSTREVVIIF
ncbi:Copper amine oxidase N-terminal domain-containing protein [Tindallia magadiensis]|uniref:Copper amine oxidase N-terminal domain-containing protein n=3 Tax=Tindallia magadiensis TaxID=69895 RepID=A0A1I3CT32_9FIRM|nr:copper amine oxidase N-terminal domain-containing protein [Tindallia magadiensis]SFH77498.1 Copper amine oxidase N-terminal domain-containing protein [Tindallia magadiensis]